MTAQKRKPETAEDLLQGCRQKLQRMWQMHLYTAVQHACAFIARCMTDGAALGHVTALQARAAHSCSLCDVFMLWLEQVAALA